MRVAAGPVAQISDTECLGVADERAIVVRVGHEIRAYRNRCSRGEADLVGAQVTDGLVACGAHQQHFSVADGAQLGSNQKLERFPVEIAGGRAFVLMPEDDPTDRPERLLATDRHDTWPDGTQRPTAR